MKDICVYICLSKMKTKTIMWYNAVLKYISTGFTFALN